MKLFKNEQQDGKEMDRYSDPNRAEDIYVAVTTNQWHWRLVWQIYNKEEIPAGTNSPAIPPDTQLSAYKVIEVLHDPPSSKEWVLRYSARGLTGSSQNWTLFRVGTAEKIPRENIVGWAEMTNMGPNDDCVACVKNLIYALESDVSM